MSTPTITDPILTATEAADYLRVHRKTLYRITRRGQVASLRTPGGRVRYRLSDLDAYLRPQSARTRTDTADDIDWSA